MAGAGATTPPPDAFPQTRLQGSAASLWLARRNASRAGHNTHCAFVPSVRRCGSHLGHYFILIAPTLLTREPLRRGIKLRTMWRCIRLRLPRCHSVCFPDLALVRANTAPACRHPPRQPAAQPREDQPGLHPRKPPPLPNA